jgi:hypothetical protein
VQLHSIVVVAQSAVVKAHGVKLAIGVCCLFTYPYFFLLRRACQLGIVKTLFIMVWMLRFLALWQDRGLGAVGSGIRHGAEF